MENKKGGDLICKRPETIIEARYKLTKRQNDILDMVFATIENDDKLQYDIDIAKYGKLYNIKDKSNIYRDLKKAVNSFEGKGFAITQKINKKKENRIYFAWFSRIIYLDGESKITIGIDPMLKELMLNAKKMCFYQIKYPLNFHNIYSKRIYYYLKSFEDTGWRIDNLDELRIKLDCPKTYERYADFKRSVLKPAYEEINDGSDISFEYEEIKIKGKVTQIKFAIRTNKLKISKEPKPPLSNATNEIAATLKEVKDTNQDLQGKIEIIVRMMKDNEITPSEARSIYISAEGNMDCIAQVYEHFKNKEAKTSFVGLMIDMVKPGAFNLPKKNSKGTKFGNYEQRPYDGSDGGMTYDELEKKLLGWDDPEDNIGEEYQQGKMLVD